jgi:hypothetical protein
MFAPCHNNATWPFIFMFGHCIVLVQVITWQCFIMLMFYVHDSSTFIYLQLLSCCFVIFCICPIYCFKPFMTLWHYLVHLTNKFSKPNYLTPSLANLNGYETFTITFTTNLRISFEIFHLFLSLLLPFSHTLWNFLF